MIDASFFQKQQLTNDIFTFWFKPEQAIGFQPGQFIELYLPHEHDERGSSRWFTISSSPSLDDLSITTRLTARSPSSYKSKLKVLSPGDKVKLSQPMGDFVLPISKTAHVICIAFGVGITPFMSMRQSSKSPSHTLLHIPAKISDSKLHKIFLNSNFSYRSLADSELLPVVDNDISAASNYYVFVAGPEHKVERTRGQLISSGVSPSRIVTDYFHNY